MINRIVLVGRLTKDPDLRYTPNGKSVASFTLAVNRRFSNQSGERETDFIDIVVWGKTAETCANYLGKGRLAGVEGRLQIRNFETKDGQKRKAAEVVADDVIFLDSGNKQKANAPAPAAQETANSSNDEDFGSEIKLSQNNNEDTVPF